MVMDDGEVMEDYICSGFIGECDEEKRYTTKLR